MTKKHLEMGNLKQTELQRLKTEEERLRIRRENKNHKKQRLATLKRLKRGDDNELERSLRLEKVVAANSSGWPWRQKKKEEQEQDWRMMQLPKTAQVGHGDGRRKKSKTGEMVATSTAHVRPD